jgi:ABC-type molybdate transport system permease subunit
MVTATKLSRPILNMALTGIPLAPMLWRVETAARTLGADPHWTFLLVTLPLALPGTIAGAVLCFAKALGEFDAAAKRAGHPDSRRRI